LKGKMVGAWQEKTPFTSEISLRTHDMWKKDQSTFNHQQSCGGVLRVFQFLPLGILTGWLGICAKLNLHRNCDQM
jgi:hypothetical protein